MEQKLDDLRREHAKTSVALRQAEAQITRERARVEAVAEERYQDLYQQFLQVQHQLQTTVQERNMLKANLARAPPPPRLPRPPVTNDGVDAEATHTGSAAVAAGSGGHGGGTEPSPEVLLQRAPATPRRLATMEFTPAPVTPPPRSTEDQPRDGLPVPTPPVHRAGTAISEASPEGLFGPRKVPSLSPAFSSRFLVAHPACRCQLRAARRCRRCCGACKPSPWLSWRATARMT